MEYARNALKSDINGQKKFDNSEFINIYKRDHGMPSTKDNETDVKDYLHKLLDYKNSSDELSGDETNHRVMTNKL